MVTAIILGIVGLLLIIGIIRVVMLPSNGFGDFLMQILLLDLLIDLVEIIGEAIAAILGDSW